MSLGAGAGARSGGWGEEEEDVPNDSRGLGYG